MSKENFKARLSPSGLPGRTVRLSAEIPNHSLITVLRLFQYFSKQKILMLLILFLLLVNTISTIAGSYLLRPIINEYIIPHNFNGFLKMILLLSGLYITGSIAAIWQNRFMIHAAQQAINNLRMDLFSKIQALPIIFFDSNSRGELMSRFSNDIDTISEALNTSITQLLTSVLTLTGIFLIMLYISPLLSLVTLTIVPFMLWIAALIINKSKNYFKDQQDGIGAVNSYVEEMISGQKVVEVFCFQQMTEAAFEVVNYELRDKSSKAQFYSGIMMPVIQNINTINFALTAAVGGLLAVLRGLDIGGLAAFLQYSRQFGRPVNEVSSQYNTFQAALAGAERIFEILDKNPEIPDSPEAVELLHIKGDIVFNQVSFQYDSGKPILKNISINAIAGKKIALVGATGAGKTTIMNLLPRFYDIQSGEISIDGINITNIKRASLRRSMAIVLQDTHLFSGTVMENIRYGALNASDTEVIHAATLAGADSFISRLPKGYNTLLENDGDRLSQGQRQLLNIARATVASPAILILDEATSSIDTRTEEIIQKGIDQLMKGRTSFVIAHRLSTVKNADEIMVLENGEIIERGNHADLLRLKGKYFALYNGQFD
jgi:ATP-binding cassette subfamily B protein